MPSLAHAPVLFGPPCCSQLLKMRLWVFGMVFGKMHEPSIGDYLERSEAREMGKVPLIATDCH